MLLMLVRLICCVAATSACLQCNEEIRKMHEDYILSAPSVQQQISLKQIINEVYDRYKKTSQEWDGVIARGTLFRVTGEYKNEFNKFLKTQKGEFQTAQFIQVVERAKEILNLHLKNTELCFNRCGILRRRVLDCVKCQWIVHVCPSPTGSVDCGVTHRKAMVGGFAKIDCNQPWHSFVFGSLVYDFSFAPDTTRDFTPLRRQSKPFMLLNKVRERNQGTYHCSLRNENQTIYELEIYLAVTPRPPPRKIIPVQPAVLEPKTDFFLLKVKVMYCIVIVVSSAMNIYIVKSLWLIIFERRKRNRWL
ncbi:izumo sperm-egg fusion protein 1 [Neosynchiropus ocellatus]